MFVSSHYVAPVGPLKGLSCLGVRWKLSWVMQLCQVDIHVWKKQPENIWGDWDLRFTLIFFLFARPKKTSPNVFYSRNGFLWGGGV